MVLSVFIRRKIKFHDLNSLWNVTVNTPLIKHANSGLDFFILSIVHEQNVQFLFIPINTVTFHVRTLNIFILINYVMF